MLELTLTNNGFKTRDTTGKCAPVSVMLPEREYRFPCGEYVYRKPMHLPHISEAYDALKAEGFSDEVIIYKLIELYLPWRCFSVGRFEAIQLVIGLIGHRGAGKTASAAFILFFDYLLRQKPVFSNVPLDAVVRYRDIEIELHSQPWKVGDNLAEKASENGGAVFLDEINMVAAEGSRYMAGANLEWANALQQVRKFGLDVLWTCQSWSWVDSRTRWQTDFLLEVRDALNSKEYNAVCPGDKALWSVYALSGLTGDFDLSYETNHRYITQYETWTGMQWIRPIWPLYPTKMRQGEVSYLDEFKKSKTAARREQEYDFMVAREMPLRKFVENMGDFDSIMSSDLWRIVGINGPEDAGLRQMLARIMQEKGYERRREPNGERRYYYIKKEILHGY